MCAHDNWSGQLSHCEERRKTFPEQTAVRQEKQIQHVIGMKRINWATWVPDKRDTSELNSTN